MRRYFIALAFLALAMPAVPGNKNLADYPLRIHIFRRTETTFYHNRVTEDAKGEGRANLFESGQARAVDFQFNCAKQLPTSSGFETFPARWKTPNRELEVLIPEFGKQDRYDTCKLEVLLKDFAYVSRNGVLGTEPVDAFKQWMVKHDYDPEHGKNAPTQLAPSSAAQASSPSPAQPPQ
jgi:hypothetical protein